MVLNCASQIHLGVTTHLCLISLSTVKILPAFLIYSEYFQSFYKAQLTSLGTDPTFPKQPFLNYVIFTGHNRLDSCTIPSLYEFGIGMHRLKLNKLWSVLPVFYSHYFFSIRKYSKHTKAPNSLNPK